MDERVAQARLLYERVVFGGDTNALTEADRELDAVEADLAVARGRIMHTRFLLRRDEDPDQAGGDPGELALFERAAQLYRALGDVRGEAEAQFWVGCFHQVARRDNGTALPALERSLELASQVDDKATMSYALRHLGIAEHAAGRPEAARQRLEESTQLRREIGLLPGVAANLIGLAYIAAGQGRDDASALLDEAGAIAEASDAQRILQSVNQARAELSYQNRADLSHQAWARANWARPISAVCARRTRATGVAPASRTAAASPGRSASVAPPYWRSRAS